MFTQKINIKLQFSFEFVEFDIDSQSHVYEPLECNWTCADDREFGLALNRIFDQMFYQVLERVVTQDWQH